jgi:addiction module HigA family antidote
MARELTPTHPGKHLTEFLDEYGLTPYALAKAIHVPRSRVEALVRCQRGITADTAVRLGRFFATSPEFWMNLQAHHDLVLAAEALAAESTPIQPVAA